jgi:hypothetical protein
MLGEYQDLRGGVRNMHEQENTFLELKSVVLSLK